MEKQQSENNQAAKFFNMVGLVKYENVLVCHDLTKVCNCKCSDLPTTDLPTTNVLLATDIMLIASTLREDDSYVRAMTET